MDRTKSSLSSMTPGKVFGNNDDTRLSFVKLFLFVVIIGFLWALLDSVLIRHDVELRDLFFIFGSILLVTIALVITAKTKKHLFGRIVLHLTTILIVLYVLQNTLNALSWVFVGPIIIILIERQLPALIMLGVYSTTILVVQFQPFLPSLYQQKDVTTAVMSIVVISTFLFVYKRQYDRNTRATFENEQKLEQLTTQLKSEIEARSQNMRGLAEALENLSHQNKLLNDGRAALANVLEDEQQLREELQLAKESVELKVKQRTAQLHEEHARLRATIESLPVGLVILDDELKQVRCNRVITKLIKEIVVKTTTIEAVDFLFKSLKIKNKVHDSLEDKKSIFIQELDYKNKVLRIYIAPITVEKESETTGVVVVVEDITEEKVMERSKEEFLSIASHELRTPLTAIRGNAKLLDSAYKERVNDPIFNELTRDIRLSSERLIGIVNDYLETSSLEQNKIIFKPEFFSIDKLAFDIVHELSSAARDKGLYLEMAEHKDTVIPPVYADAKRVSQVLVNLISNGLHYTKKGGVTINISPHGLDQVAIAVIDTGVGISEKNRKLLFRKFQKADDNVLTRDWKRSTGLGLYIAKLLTGLMGGTIALDYSRVGEGSSFVFSLPTKPPADRG